MRFDMEVNIVGSLTADGLNLLANMFYSQNNLITPMHYDSVAVSTEKNSTSADLDVSKFNKFRNVKDNAFISGVATQDSLSIFKMLIRENIIIPMFNGGDLLFYKYKYRWSINNIVKLSEWNQDVHAYSCILDDDADDASIQVFTLKLADPGYLGYNKEFTFVDYSRIQVKKIMKVDLPQKSSLNIIYCCMDSKEIYEVSSTSANTYKVFDIDFVQDVLPIYPALQDRWVVVGDKTDLIYFHNGYNWNNIVADRAFRLSIDDYKFVTYNDPLSANKRILLTNCKRILYSNLKIGSGPNRQRVMAGLPEFPTKNLTVNGITQDSTGDLYYNVLESAILLTNKTAADYDIVASFEVYPLVTYTQTSRISRDDVVYGNVNITPSGINFKNGILCVYNTFSPTIATEYGSYIPLPTQLTMTTDKNEVNALEGVKVKAQLSGIDGIPIKGAKIKFKLNQDPTEKLAQWMGSGTSEFESFTGVDGATDAILMQMISKYGFFIQKEWVSGNVINVPFNLGSINTSRIYLYVITADDPILGKLSAKSSIGEQPISDYYNGPGRLDSYSINGRKIAYVKMNTKYLPGSRILQSSYIKPTSTIKFSNKRMTIKDLYIQQDITKNITMVNKTGESSFQVPLDDQTAYTHFTIPTGGEVNHINAAGWDPNYLPEATKTTYTVKDIEVVVKDGVSIIYEDQLPGTTGDPQDNRIVGYWLITGSGGNVGVSCSFDSDMVSLESEEVEINVSNYIKSEQEFIISESDITNQNAVLGSFGYYSISEFLKNPYNMSANVYCCIYSDPVTHSCINKSSVDIVDQATGLITKKKVSSFYALDSANSTTCVHSPNYDATLPSAQRCLGLDAHYVNPFILHVQK